MLEINEKGPMKHVVARQIRREVQREKGKLLYEKELNEQNVILLTLQEINRKQTILAKQNNTIIAYLEKLTNAPSGKVHFIHIQNYPKTFGEVFIDFVRGDKDGRSVLPPTTTHTFPYTKVFMMKITNDGPADIKFKTDRHAQMIVLKAGENEVINENENFSLTELRISNESLIDNANIRLILYA